MNSKKVLITGTSRGIGLSTALFFLHHDNKVFGMDIEDAPEDLKSYKNYTHIKCSVMDPTSFPNIPDIQYVVCNAGIQEGENVGEVMEVNFWGVDNIIKKYALQKSCRSVVIVGSVSGITGAEFGEYVASKGALIPYTKFIANKIATWGGICNCIAPGGVITELNEPVLNDKKLWAKIMELTPLKRWANSNEIAEWVYFLSAQRFCTGQTIVVDGGESIKSNFVWPED